MSNARAGIANRVGARSADRVLSAVPDSGLRRAEVVGVPVQKLRQREPPLSSNLKD